VIAQGIDCARGFLRKPRISDSSFEEIYMASLGSARVRVVDPRKGQPTLVKCLIVHPMHSGDATDPKTGKKIPAHFIKKIYGEFNGQAVFEADWSVSISRNPYLAYYFTPHESGELKMTWEDNQGGVFTHEEKVSV